MLISYNLNIDGPQQRHMSISNNQSDLHFQ